MIKLRIEGIPQEVKKIINHLKKYMAVYGESEPCFIEDSDGSMIRI